MERSLRIVTMTPENCANLGCPCFLNPAHKSHLEKIEWLRNRFPEGFIIKSLFVETEKKPIGFIEYVSGEYAWRAVDAKDYLFIHCIWINPNKYKEKGYGSLLVNEALNDAKAQGKTGVAVITSEGSFIASKDLFVKNGFEVVDKSDRFELLVKQFKKGNFPKFTNWQNQLTQYKGLNIVFSNQCPWVIRSIKELIEIAEQKTLNLKVTELKTAKEAQNAPSIYATFTLIYDGKIFADHYVSSTRFLNILKKDMKLIK